MKKLILPLLLLSMFAVVSAVAWVPGDGVCDYSVGENYVNSVDDCLHNLCDATGYITPDECDGYGYIAEEDCPDSDCDGTCVDETMRGEVEAFCTDLYSYIDPDDCPEADGAEDDGVERMTYEEWEEARATETGTVSGGCSASQCNAMGFYDCEDEPINGNLFFIILILSMIILYQNQNKIKRLI